MKSILVLYPIRPYAEDMMIGRESPEMKGRYAEIYQRLIAARYSGFQVVWMMFSEQGSVINPDLSLLWEGISIRESDIVAACGVSFKEHCEKRSYPDPKAILQACPRPVEKLIIGGFHFGDCVEKVAECAFKEGIDVAVDDDLTELFFHRVRDRKGNPSFSRIPLSRDKSIIRTRRRLLKSAGTFHLNLVRETRQGKPWLSKI